MSKAFFNCPLGSFYTALFKICPESLIVSRRCLNSILSHITANSHLNCTANMAIHFRFWLLMADGHARECLDFVIGNINFLVSTTTRRHMTRSLARDWSILSLSMAIETLLRFTLSVKGAKLKIKTIETKLGH